MGIVVFCTVDACCVVDKIDVDTSFCVLLLEDALEVFSEFEQPIILTESNTEHIKIAISFFMMVSPLQNN